MPDRMQKGDPERRWRALVEGIPQLIWCATEPGQWSWSSRQWQEYTGQSFDQSLGWGWLDAVHPEDRDFARKCWSDAPKAGELTAEFRLRHAASGSYRWHKTQAFPVRDNQVIVEWLGTSTDVDDLRQARQRLSIVNAELEHRVRNGLAVVRSIIRRTAAESADMDELAALTMSRIDALARAQSLITPARAGGINLGQLVREEFRVHGVEIGSLGERLLIDGPDVPLRGRFGECFAIILNELIANSMHVGALARDDDRLRLTWMLESGPRSHFSFQWDEDYRSADHGSFTAGEFGHDMVTETLCYEFDAEASVTFSDSRLRVVAVVPVSHALLHRPA